MLCRTTTACIAIAILSLTVAQSASAAQRPGSTTRPTEPAELQAHLEELLKKAARATEITHKDPPLRYETAKEIARLTREDPDVCIPILLDKAGKGTGFRHNSTEMRLVALEALGLAGAEAKRAIPVLAERLSEAMVDPGEPSLLAEPVPRHPELSGITLPEREDPKITIALAEALCRIGPHDASIVPVLIKALSHEECYVRGHAVDLLHDFGARAAPAKEALVSVMNDYPWIALPARATLRKIAPDDAQLQHKLDVLDFCDLAWTPEIMLWPITLVLQLITVACLAWGALAVRGKQRRILLGAVGLLVLPIPLSEMWRHDALAFEGGGPAYLIVNLIHIVLAVGVWNAITDSIIPPDQGEGAAAPVLPPARHAISILPSVFLVWALPLLSTPLAIGVESGGTDTVAPPPGYKWVGTPPMESGCYLIIFAVTLLIAMIVGAGMAQRRSKGIGRYLVYPNILLALAAVLLNLLVPALEMR